HFGLFDPRTFAGSFRRAAGSALTEFGPSSQERGIVSAQQKRPLYAFIAISFICCLVIASGVRSKALVAAVTETVHTAVATAPRLSPLTGGSDPEPVQPPAAVAHAAPVHDGGDRVRPAVARDVRAGASVAPARHTGPAPDRDRR